MITKIQNAESIILETITDKTRDILIKFNSEAVEFFTKSKKYEMDVDRKDGSKVDRLFVLNGYNTTRFDNGLISKLTISID